MRLITVTRGVALGGVALMSLAQSAYADSGEKTPLHLGTSNAAHAATSSGGSGILRTIIAMVVVIAVIYAIARIMRAVKGGQLRASGTGLQSIATLPLGSGRSIALVRAGREVVLVGVAEHGVTPIKTYSEAEAIANGIELPYDEGDFDQTDRPLGRALEQLRKMTVRP
jgi:flagellar protein FliO/FliZ